MPNDPTRTARAESPEEQVAVLRQEIAELREQVEIAARLARVEQGVGLILDVLGVARGSQPVRHPNLDAAGAR